VKAATAARAAKDAATVIVAADATVIAARAVKAAAAADVTVAGAATVIAARAAKAVATVVLAVKVAEKAAGTKVRPPSSRLRS
jgi:hypothetical protein